MSPGAPACPAAPDWFPGGTVRGWQWEERPVHAVSCPAGGGTAAGRASGLCSASSWNSWGSSARSPLSSPGPSSVRKRRTPGSGERGMMPLWARTVWPRGFGLWKQSPGPVPGASSRQRDALGILRWQPPSHGPAAAPDAAQGDWGATRLPGASSGTSTQTGVGTVLLAPCV